MLLACVANAPVGSFFAAILVLSVTPFLTIMLPFMAIIWQYFDVPAIGIDPQKEEIGCRPVWADGSSSLESNSDAVRTGYGTGRVLCLTKYYIPMVKGQRDPLAAPPPMRLL
jgi:hypothetical protein